MELAALAVQPPQQPDLLGQYGKMMQLRNLGQQGQIQQQQIQAQTMENQQRQMDLQDQQKFRQAFIDNNGDPQKTYDAAAKSGVSPKLLIPFKQQTQALTMQTMEMGEKAIAFQRTQNDLIQGAHDAVTAAPPEARPQVYAQQLQGLQKAGVDVSKLPPQYPGDAALPMLGATLNSHKQILDDAAKQAETFKNQQQGQEAQAGTAEKQATAKFYQDHPGAGAPGVPAETASLASFLMSHPGARPDQYPAYKAKQDALATLPIEIAKKQADQAIADGDPNAAAKLLVDGTVAPAQIISSRKPAFAEAAFTAAQKMQPGWNAQKADADYKVASSPQQVAFFGSAKSLTDKGGTLDQLAAAAKDIPANQIPVFNSVADAVKASTGSGPIAKYAALTLGVADDYSKVMGGGAGSDTSRTQAMNIIAAKQSPEQRAAAIEGIRGAVTSQTNSRIGSNSVLQKMYGSTTSDSGVKVTDPNGGIHTFPDQASANKFKTLAHIQ